MSSVFSTPTLDFPKMPPHLQSQDSMLSLRGQANPAPLVNSQFDLKSIQNENYDLKPRFPMAQPRVNRPQSVPQPLPFTASWLTEVARISPISPPERYLYHPNVIDDYRRFRYHPYYSSNQSVYRGNFTETSQRFSYFNERHQGHLPYYTQSNEHFKYPVMNGVTPLHKNNIPSMYSQRPNGVSKFMNSGYTTDYTSNRIEGNCQSLKYVESPIAQETNITKSTASKPSPRITDLPKDNTPIHSHFKKGSLVTLGKAIKKVEELTTEDFLEAVKHSDDLELEPSTVKSLNAGTSIYNLTVTFSISSAAKEVCVEISRNHPLFVFDSGWSSCDPKKTFEVYGLSVKLLKPGDVCIALKKRDQKDTERKSKSIMPPPQTLPRSGHCSHSSINNVSSSELRSNSVSEKVTSNPDLHSLKQISDHYLDQGGKIPNTVTTVSVLSTVPSTVSVLSTSSGDLSNENVTEKNVKNKPKRNFVERKSINRSLMEIKFKRRKRRWSDPQF